MEEVARHLVPFWPTTADVARELGLTFDEADELLRKHNVTARGTRDASDAFVVVWNQGEVAELVRLVAARRERADS